MPETNPQALSSVSETPRIPLILPLPDALAELSLVGGKGMSLAKLARMGLPVPDGFHVTTAAYRRIVADHGLQEQILAAVSASAPDQPAALEAASRQIGKLFAQLAIPDEIAGAIRQAYAGLGKGDVPVAVCSSATGVASRRIHTGQVITVDGSAGTVALKKG